ncbi:uncharacterized protein LOC135349615 [Halichondria panicea]|uniref:uncharacterized protein LOC135349615 n=1 Tax=Halichondria panicea TaxID=6063 RepID=UPI00312BA00D
MDEPSVLQVVNPVHGAGAGAEDVLNTEEGANVHGFKGRSIMFTTEQRTVLMRYFEEYGMTSTHRRNTELMQRCAQEVHTSIDRIKNWIGSEAVKRKRKAGILPRPKIEIAGNDTLPKVIATPPTKKIKRVNGYNLFFSHVVRTRDDVGSEFKERNAKVALKWAEQTEEERKQWALKAEAVCASSIQELVASSQPAPLGLSSLLSPAMASDLGGTGSLVEKALLGIQEKFELLEQLGFEGYAVLVNTGELATHTLGTGKGKSFHKMRQNLGKPLENPFIGHVFSEDTELSSLSSLGSGLPSLLPIKRMSSGLLPSLSSLDTMQKSVLNAFALKYKVATGRSEVPYDNLASLGVQVYGLPLGIPFHSPILYNQQQLQQILANLEKIVFLKGGHQGSLPDTLTEVELAAQSLVTSGHDLHIGAEEEAVQ